MTKEIHVVAYNDCWPTVFEAEKNKILKALGDNCLSLHHIGSTSVPGLEAKPVLDMMMELVNPDQGIGPLEQLGYAYKGEINIPFRLFFAKKDAVHLHVYEKGNPEVALNLVFRDYLRAHPPERQEYTQLKRTLLSQESSFEKSGGRFSGYTLGKNDFIQSILERARFEGLCLRICTHDKEWRRYHELRRTLLFEPKGLVYDAHHPSLTNPGCTHFVLYKGTHIVSVAQIEFFQGGFGALRAVATDPLYQKQGYGVHMVGLLEKWAYRRGVRVLKTHANWHAQNFYRKLGYVEMAFEDICITPDVVDLGKELLPQAF
jgi:GrpB-like predicted nucleotidyltransferase (UPF0157 family)/GNAT superfamily N-acetyltransferase